jgi:hypothetical protein
VFNEELLAPDREMPWRARVILSRMRKDLKMIPVFQKMENRELQQIRRHLLQDALRANRQSDLLCAILQNSDLDVRSRQINDVSLDFKQHLFIRLVVYSAQAPFKVSAQMTTKYDVERAIVL